MRTTIRVLDEAGHRHRGALSYAGNVPRRPPEPPDEFAIVLLERPLPVRALPACTAVCVPGPAPQPAGSHRRRSVTVSALRRRLLPAPLGMQFAAGRVAHPGGSLPGKAVFHRNGPATFDALALLLIDQRQAELLAPYTALIRRELRAGPGANPSLVLRSRLDPPRAADAPPPSAPAIKRLRRVLRALEQRQRPPVEIEQFRDDLRFLALFESGEHALHREALERLLRDLGDMPARRASAGPRRRATVVPLRPRAPDA